MTLSKVRISDGLNLSVINTNKFKSGIFTFTVAVPYTAKNAVLSALLIGVLKRGTKSYPDLAAISRRLDELYASSVDLRSSRLGKNLTVTVTADILDERYIPDSTDILGGVLEIVEETLEAPNLENGVFPISVFEQEKRFLRDSIDASVNQTRAYAGIRLNELLFANDPEFSTLEQTKDIIDSIDSQSLTSFFNSYVKCAPINVFYVGSMSTDAIKEKLSGRFVCHRGNGVTPVFPFAEPVCKLRSVTEKMPVSQGKLAMGFKTNVAVKEGSDAHYAVILLNEIFGGSAASKLFMNVREKLSLCYYCSSSYNQYLGTMTVSSGIESKNREAAENAILAELEAIRKGHISDVEFFAAKRSLENSYRQVYDNPYDLQASFGNRAFFGLSDSLDDSREKLMKVTKDQVIAAAKNTVLDSVFFIEGTEPCTEEECDE